jgi:hypothetical protein
MRREPSVAMTPDATCMPALPRMRRPEKSACRPSCSTRSWSPRDTKRSVRLGGASRTPQALHCCEHGYTGAKERRGTRHQPVQYARSGIRYLRSLEPRAQHGADDCAAEWRVSASGRFDVMLPFSRSRGRSKRVGASHGAVKEPDPSKRMPSLAEKHEPVSLGVSSPISSSATRGIGAARSRRGQCAGAPRVLDEG